MAYDYEEQGFRSPTPLVGMYIAAASVICSLAMAVDAILGFYYKKFWFPCRFFTLNVAWLTLLAIAVKLPMDLNSELPAPKLSSTVLMSTAMANFMPSLGSMGNEAIFMNMTAFGILVITLLGNVSIELGTDGLNPLSIEHAFVLSFLAILFMIMCFSSIAVPTMKKHLECMYRRKHRAISSEDPKENGMDTIEKLKEDVKKYGVMAETGNPQFMVARSVTCAACCAICCLNGLVWLKMIIFGTAVNYSGPLVIYTANNYSSSDCQVRGAAINSGSDYGVTTSFISMIQFLGVVIGMISPLFRLMFAVKVELSRRTDKTARSLFKLEKYWVERMKHWKERPLVLRIHGRRCRKVAHKTKNLMLGFCMKIQIVVVAVSKSLFLLCTFLVWPFFSCLFYFLRCRDRLKSNVPKNKPGSESENDKNFNASQYVLHLEGEEHLPRSMKNKDTTHKLIQKGQKRQPQKLRQLLNELTSFNGLAEFDSNQVPSLLSPEPPNSWKLPVVTLSSIVMALPNLDNEKVKSLLHNINKGMVYVSFVDIVLTTKRDLKKVSEAADATWLDVNLLGRWQGENLRKMSFGGKTSKETLEKLCGMADNYVSEFVKTKNIVSDDLDLPIKVIAANSMYRIGQTLLLKYNGVNEPTDEELFEHISIIIANILGACLTNIPQVITMNFESIALEKREESVHEAARILGETEEILEILQKHDLPNLTPEQMLYVDEWRTSMNEKNPSVPSFVSTGSNISSSSAHEVQITVE